MGVESITHTDPPSLAIIIPAWRDRHFAEALASIRDQADHRFRLYIFDDASSDDLRSIVESAGVGLDIIYHRFEENLGGQDLVAHWHRCIALTENEPWIWLFSDDDIAEPDCVAAFYQLLESDIKGATLLRFNNVVINDAGQVIQRPTPHPEKENALELLEATLTAPTRLWCVPDHIFSREAYLKTEGFVNFPKALFADNATWIRMTALGHVRTIPEVRIYFRKHQLGTSSGMISTYRNEFLVAIAKFLEFVISTTQRRWPERLDHHRSLARHRYAHVIFRSDAGISFGEVSPLTQLLWRSLGGPRWPIYFRLQSYAIRTYARTLPGLKSIALWRTPRNSSRLATSDKANIST